MLAIYQTHYMSRLQAIPNFFHFTAHLYSSNMPPNTSIHLIRFFHTFNNTEEAKQFAFTETFI